MTPADGPDPRLRLLARIAGVGTGTGLVLALGVGAAGGTGRSGAAVLVLALALTAALVGAVGTVTLAVDEHRGRPVRRARIVVTVAGFLGATLLMAMLVGLGA